MQVRSIILAAVSALVVFVFVKLVLDAQGSSSAKLNDEELQKALSSYRQRQAQSDRAVATPKYVAPRRKSSDARDDEPEVSEPAATYEAPEPEEEERVFTDTVDLKNQMDQANRFYDKADYESARDAAIEILGGHPDNVRMLRIVVSSSCIMAEEEMATRYYEKLPERDKRQMARRCTRYGIEFPEAN